MLKKELQIPEATVNQLIDKGEFKEAYSLLKKSEVDIFFLIESAINIKMFNEAQDLFYNINRESLSLIDQKRYDFVEILVCHSEESFESAIEKGIYFLKFENTCIREKVVIAIEISFCYRKLSKFHEALQLMLHYEDSAKKLNEFYQGHYYNALGLVYWSAGNFTVALDGFEKSLNAFMQIENENGIARSYNNQAIVYNDLGDLDKSLKMYEKSIEIHFRLGNDFDLGIVYNNLAVIYQKKGLLGLSIKYYEVALQAMEKIEHKTYQAVLHSNIGSLECARGNLHKALEHLEISKSIFYSLNQLKHFAMVLTMIAEVFFEKGDFSKGKQIMLESLSIKKKLTNKLDLVISIFTLYWYIYIYNEEYDPEILSMVNLLPMEPYESKNIENYTIMIKSMLELRNRKFKTVIESFVQIKNQEGIEYNHKIMVIKSLAICELEIWKMDVTETNFSNLRAILDELREICESNNLTSSYCDSLLIQSKFENSLFLFDKALTTLNIGLEIAIKSDLTKHIKFFEYEIKKQSERLRDIHNTPETNQTINIDDLKNYILLINQIIKQF